jgi:hypothetical protein
MRFIPLLLLFTLPLVGCGKDSPLAPSVSIVSPEEAVQYYAEQKILFEGLIADDSMSPNELTVLWKSDIDGVLDWASEPDSRGKLLGYGMLSEGQHAISLTVTDLDELNGRDIHLISVGPVNTAPVCSFTAPPTGTATNEGDTVSLIAEVDDVDVGPVDLNVSWSSDLAGDLGTSTANLDGIASLETTALALGTHTITLTVTDEMGLECQAQVVHKIGQVPRLSWVWPDADAILSTENPGYAHVNIDDDYHNVEELVVTWTSNIDGSLIPDPTDAFGNSMRDLGDLSLGAHILTATATNPDDLTGTASLTFMINGIPGAPSVVIQPDPANSPDDLTAVVTGGADPEGDSQSFTYQWSKNGVLDSSLTGDVVPNPVTSKGEIWTVRVTPSDGYGDGPLGEAEITVLNTLPVVSVVSITPTSPGVNDPLVCSYGFSDEDNDADASTMEWTVGSTVVGTDASLGAGILSKGDTVVCTVTANDGEDTGNSVNDSVTLLNSVPVVSAVSIDPSSPTVSDALTCSYTFVDDDNDADASGVTWTVGSTTVGTGTTLTAGNAAKGDTVVCSVEADDAEDTGNTATASTTLQNSAPTTPVVSISPSAPVAQTDDLVCSIDTASTDADGDTVTYTFMWEVGTVSWTGSTSTTAASGDTIAASDLNYDEEWTCVVTPDDGTVSGTAGENSVTVVCQDADGDGYADPACGGTDCDDSDSTLTPEDADGDGYSTCDGDCDDSDASLELDDADSDGYSTCDGDCDDSDASLELDDADSDGYSTCDGDCDDSDASLELDDADSDGYSTCDGDCDDGDASLELDDADNDGFSTCDGDCDDNDSSVTTACADGQAMLTSGSWIDVTYEVCGSGASCDANDAKAACSAVGAKVLSHASSGTSSVKSLGASSSCQYSISYFTVDSSMAGSDCLVGISNLEWSGCCGTSDWHGSTVPFGSASSIFGYVNSGNSGYQSGYSNSGGTTWGCQSESQDAGPGSCSTLYVACEY